MRQRSVIQDAWAQLLSLLSAFSETLGKSFDLFLLGKNSLLVFSIELRDSCCGLCVCMPSPPLFSTNGSWTACLLVYGEKGSCMRVLGSALRTENVILYPNRLPGHLLAFPFLPQFSAPKTPHFSLHPS